MGEAGNTADRETAARMAREAAERARRAEIMKKINELEEEKRECADCISSLSAASGQLTGLVASWNTSYSNGMQSDIVREVTISGVFEGAVASGIKSGMSFAMSKMESSMTGIDQVMEDVSIQIGKLDQYIDKLDAEIRSLRASL